MRVILAAILAAIFAASGPVSASDDHKALADQLRETEARGLSALSPSRLRAMLRAPDIGTSFNPTLAWLDNQPVAEGGPQWECLAEALYFEARGETVRGQFAVAEVIMNRVESARFPETVCGVVNQGTGQRYQCQFTYTCDGLAERIHEPRAFDRVAKVARAVLDDRAPELTDGATHYHTTSVRPRWSRIYTRTARIGKHIFYRHTYRTASK